MTDLYSKEGIFGNFSYASPGVSRGLIVAMCLNGNTIFPIRDNSKILVVGAGSGYEVVFYRKHGHTVKAIDLFAPEIDMVREVTTIGSAIDMPFNDKEFDVVHCTEMMEHIQEEETDAILKECQRVAEKFVFTIATRDDAPYCTHTNIHHGWWWIKKFKELGFEIESAQESAKNHLCINGVMTFFKWHDGVMIHGNC